MKQRNLIPVVLAVLFLALPLYTAPDKPPQEVAVSNFPDQQNVVGTVDVGNLPLDVDGHLLIAPERPFRFVGVTTERFDGAAGWGAMTRACFDEFPGARMSFLEDYMRTLNPPELLERAWIQNNPISTGDAANCNNWTSLASQGAAVLLDGSVRRAVDCTNEFPVACAAQ